MAMIEDDEIIQVFIEESREHMDGIESDLLDIEKDGEDINVDLVNKVFRAIHSVKGGAGFLGLETIKELAHEMENILNLIRNFELVPDSDLVNTLLTSTDKLNELIENFSESNEMDITDEVAMLKGATAANLPEEEAGTVEQTEQIKLPNGRLVFEVKVFDLNQAQKGGRILYLAEFDLLKDIERKGKTPLDVIKELQQAGMLLESKIDIDLLGGLEEQSTSMVIPFFVLFSTVLEQDLIGKLVNIDDSKIFYFDKQRNIIPVNQEQQEVAEPEPETVENIATKPEEPAVVVEEKTAPPTPAVEPEPIQKEAAVSAPAKSRPATKKKKLKDTSVSVANESLRVSVKDLDKLMTLAGELVLTRNQLLQTHATNDHKSLEASIQGVDLITSELQEAVMATRMQPIGMVLNKFQRIVRDLSNHLGKKITLVIEGEGVEMDKTIIEAIGDPLTHLIRNAVDHGVEMPDVRKSKGKNETATLKLSAFHEAGHVHIEIADNGAGIDPEVIKAKAIEKNFVSSSELEAMPESEIIKLIFRPGFSTAKQISDVSGRGVGMDVVFNNLSKIGGTVDIRSKVNEGTTISIKLPLTLAIISSLIITDGKDRFALPQVNLVELVRIPIGQYSERIEKIDDAVMLRLRGELLPLVQLKNALQSNGNGKFSKEREEELLNMDKHTEHDAVNVVVVNAGSFNYGLIVNELMDTEEIVVKPLGLHLRNIETYSGATILGDGKAVLILDVIGISNTMKLKPVKEQRVLERKIENGLKQTDSQSMIIVDNGAEEQFAIPLGLISRIEKIHKDDPVETGGKMALKYRGGNLIVLSIEDVANVKPRVEVENPYVVIFQFSGKEIGVIVSNIVDVVESGVAVDDETFVQPGIVGSSIMLNKITLMLDLYGLAEASMPEKVEERVEEIQRKSTTQKQNTILIVEDSKFFLNQIKGFTEDAGYQVKFAYDGVEGLEQLSASEEDIDLVLTDIEMPNMDGFQLTREIRSNPKYQDLPVLALTSVAGREAEETAREVGIDEYLIKLDREKVLQNIESYLTNGRQN